MAQNRRPPAFQEYPAAMIANRGFRLMSLAERGLLYSMRLECWENHSLPSQPAQLAKYLGYTESEIQAALPAVMPFFKEDTQGLLYSPELEDYRTYLAERHAKQAAGGKRSAENKKKQGNSSKTGPADRGQGYSRSRSEVSKSHRSNLQDTYKSPASNLQVLSTDQSSSGQINPVTLGSSDFIDSTIDDDFAGEYDRASNGG